MRPAFSLRSGRSRHAGPRPTLLRPDASLVAVGLRGGASEVVANARSRGDVRTVPTSAARIRPAHSPRRGGSATVRSGRRGGDGHARRVSRTHAAPTQAISQGARCSPGRPRSRSAARVEAGAPAGADGGRASGSVVPLPDLDNVAGDHRSARLSQERPDQDEAQAIAMTRGNTPRARPFWPAGPSKPCQSTSGPPMTRPGSVVGPPRSRAETRERGRKPSRPPRPPR